MIRIYKRIFLGLKILAVVVIIFLALIYALSNKRLTKQHEIPPLPELTFSTDSTTLARGKHIATSFGNCVECHGTDLGGKIYSDKGPVVQVVGSNLTKGKGGVGASLTDQDWIRSIKHGVHRDGTSMIVMPSETFVYMQDEDLAALISYLKQLPAVDRELPRSKFHLLGRTLLAMGKLPILVAEKTKHFDKPIKVRATATEEYGKYLADISGCRGCHGLNLSGGRVAGPPGTPLTTNLTPTGLGSWTEKQFFQVLREGKRPDGTSISDFMPWRSIGKMTNDEIHAIWLYLKTVPPMPTGNR